MVDFRKTAEELDKFSSSKVLEFEAKLFFRITFELRWILLPNIDFKKQIFRDEQNLKEREREK